MSPLSPCRRGHEAGSGADRPGCRCTGNRLGEGGPQTGLLMDTWAPGWVGEVHRWENERVSVGTSPWGLNPPDPDLISLSLGRGAGQGGARWALREHITPLPGSALHLRPPALRRRPHPPTVGAHGGPLQETVSPHAPPTAASGTVRPRQQLPLLCPQLHHVVRVPGGRCHTHGPPAPAPAEAMRSPCSFGQC